MHFVLKKHNLALGLTTRFRCSNANFAGSTVLVGRDRFQRERLETAFPKLCWQWERRSYRNAVERNSPLVILYTFVNTPRQRPKSQFTIALYNLSKLSNSAKSGQFKHGRRPLLASHYFSNTHYTNGKAG